MFFWKIGYRHGAVGIHTGSERLTKEGVPALGKQRVVVTTTVRHKLISKGPGSKRKTQRTRINQEVQHTSTQNAAKVKLVSFILCEENLEFGKK